MESAGLKFTVTFNITKGATNYLEYADSLSKPAPLNLHAAE